jgi:molybdopterin-synthase adenylyltransferase
MPPGDRERYSRQILFEGIGESGQGKISGARVAIVGCGALGSFQAESLTRAGIGSLLLIDRDYVELSNLQRQWLYNEADAAAETPKAVAAVARLEQLNRNVKVLPSVSDLVASNAEELLSNCDLILDGTDNFETRYILNDISVKLSIPWIYGAAVGSYGVVMPVVPDKGACFSCVYPESPAGEQPTCASDGVLSSVTASVAALQTSFALRLLVGWPDFKPFVQTVDVWSGSVRHVTLPGKTPGCVTCERHEFPHLEGNQTKPISLCGRNSVQIHDRHRKLDLPDLANRLSRLGEVRVNEFALRVSFPDYQLTFFPDGRAIVKGTTDIGKARSLYSELVGS